MVNPVVSSLNQPYIALGQGNASTLGEDYCGCNIFGKLLRKEERHVMTLGFHEITKILSLSIHSEGGMRCCELLHINPGGEFPGGGADLRDIFDAHGGATSKRDKQPSCQEM